MGHKKVMVVYFLAEVGLNGPQKFMDGYFLKGRGRVGHPSEMRKILGKTFIHLKCSVIGNSIINK